MTASKTQWVRLGDFISQRREKNNGLDVPILGVTRDGFIPPKQDGADTSLYNVFYKYDFVFNPARMELNSIYLNTKYEQAICSSLYEIFYVSQPDKLLPEYLNLFIKRDGFAKFCWFDAIGSARNYFRVANMQDVRFPLPSIEVQRELVDTYNGLKALAEQNESLAASLSTMCDALVVEAGKKYSRDKVGDLITIDDAVNDLDGDYPFLGINIKKEFMPSVANTKGLNRKKYKLMTKGKFVFSGMQTGRDVCIRIGLYNNEKLALVSPAYTTFKIKSEEVVLPEYFFLQFKRSESDRLGWFLSDGSIRSNLDWNRFEEITIPLPPIEVQRSIVNLYHCMEEAKSIAATARERIKTLCPALVLKGANS